MSFLGVDQSLSGTGVCVTDDSGAVILLETVLTKGLVGGPRLWAIMKVLRSTITALGPIAHAALEGYAYAATGRVFELGEIGGVIKVLFEEYAIPYVPVPPTTLKLYATGVGTSDKDDMLVAARSQGVDPRDDNQADALFLARIARALHLGNAKRMCEMQAIHSLLHPVTGRNKSRARKPRKLIKNAI